MLLFQTINFHMANSENPANTKDAYQQEWREITQLLIDSHRHIDDSNLEKAIVLLSSRGWRPEIRRGENPKDKVYISLIEPQYPYESPRHIDFSIFPGDGVSVTIGYQRTAGFSSDSEAQVAIARVQNLSNVELRHGEIVFTGRVGDDHVIVESASLDIEGSVIHETRDHFPYNKP